MNATLFNSTALNTTLLFNATALNSTGIGGNATTAVAAAAEACPVLIGTLHLQPYWMTLAYMLFICSLPLFLSCCCIDTHTKVVIPKFITYVAMVPLAPPKAATPAAPATESHSEEGHLGSDSYSDSGYLEGYEGYGDQEGYGYQGDYPGDYQGDYQGYLDDKYPDDGVGSFYDVESADGRARVTRQPAPVARQAAPVTQQPPALIVHEQEGAPVKMRVPTTPEEKAIIVLGRVLGTHDVFLVFLTLANFAHYIYICVTLSGGSTWMQYNELYARVYSSGIPSLAFAASLQRQLHEGGKIALVASLVATLLLLPAAITHVLPMSVAYIWVLLIVALIYILVFVLGGHLLSRCCAHYRHPLAGLRVQLFLLKLSGFFLAVVMGQMLYNWGQMLYSQSGSGYITNIAAEYHLRNTPCYFTEIAKVKQAMLNELLNLLSFVL